MMLWRFDVMLTVGAVKESDLSEEWLDSTLHKLASGSTFDDDESVKIWENWELVEQRMRAKCKQAAMRAKQNN